LAIFRRSLAEAIGRIETDPRGALFQDFLRKGPYEGDEEELPPAALATRLSDGETRTVISYIYAQMVNTFQGAVTELLASAACQQVVQSLRQRGELPADAQLYVGDAVMATRLRASGYAKGADLHVLVPGEELTVAGVAEVKSYRLSRRRLDRQVAQHLARTAQGLRIGGVDWPAERIRLGVGSRGEVARITVVPAAWKLPRTYRFQTDGERRFLVTDPGVPPDAVDRLEREERGVWRITLRWSEEALAKAAYGMTFWYMEKVGEAVYDGAVPVEWADMTPAEAGRNAATMMLYYALIRCRPPREHQRAVALYNCYGFGYALGMSFRNADGKREMLWPQDLDEIRESGVTRHGARLAP
jgi:hypothetical protein